MKLPLIAAAVLILFSANLMNAQSPAELAALWDREHLTSIAPSNVRYKDFRAYLESLSLFGVNVSKVGRSHGKRDIFQLQFGEGPLKVFMWSQMHGDEPTATSALIDMFNILRRNRKEEWVKRIDKQLTIRAVPMLNPDGAEMFIRRNAQGIDINRDAVDRKSPEAKLLKNLRDKWMPNIGFNLHNQNGLTTVGDTDKQAAISLLVVYGDAARTTSEGHERNRRVAAAMASALQNFIPGHIGRYDDSFAATAFGDNFSAWGTPTILVETGELKGQSEMFLVKMNFIALVTALRVLADGSQQGISPAAYDALPPNTSGRIFNFVFRNATLIDREKPEAAVTGDIGINVERRRADNSSPAIIRKLGQISGQTGLEEYDASDFYAVGRFLPLGVGNFGDILFYRKDRQIDWSAADLEKQFPPDAVFSIGEWFKGEGVLPRR
jgi:hypothetical protein